MSAAWLTAAFASFVLLLFLAGRRALLRVPEGQVLAVRRFGRSERVLTPGLRVLLPLADRVVRRISLTGHSMRLERRMLACGDLRAIAVEGVVFFQFLDPLEAARSGTRAHERISAELSRALAELAGSASSEALCEQPAESVSRSLKQRINRLLRSQGIMITRLQLDLAVVPTP